MKVPYGKKSLYEATEGWNVFTKITEETQQQYEMNITVEGNGCVSYDGKSIRNEEQKITALEGSTIALTLIPDVGSRLASLKINHIDVTSKVSNNQYSISDIGDDVDVEVKFENTPNMLTITASGNGSVSYDGTAIRDNTTSFTVNEGAAVVSFVPDEGCRVKKLVLDALDVTSDVVNNQYTVSDVSMGVVLKVEFEEIPSTTFNLTIKTTGKGTINYEGIAIREKMETFTLPTGTYIHLSFEADRQNYLNGVKLNATDITANLVDGQYVFKLSATTTVDAIFEKIFEKVTNDGVNYIVTSQSQKTVKVAASNFGQVLTVPATFTAEEREWTVVGVDIDALKDATNLAAIIWNVSTKFEGEVNNPNLLLYVTKKDYAPSTISNVVVGNEAESITLKDAASGNSFYCPQTFTAKKVFYEHNYSMKSGYKTCQGWETLVLPFDVSSVVGQTGTPLVPYITWTMGTNLRPFWLYALSDSGWQPARAIKANTPYIISMPSNERYNEMYRVTGNVIFQGTNVQVMASDNLTTGVNGSKHFVANYQYKKNTNDIYPLNVNNEWAEYAGTSPVEGSVFIRNLRPVHPFEAYLTVEGSDAVREVIPLFEDEGTSGIGAIPLLGGRITDRTVYNMQGQQLSAPKRGLNIVGGRKIVVR